jgi:hypothetical protein
VGFCGKTAIILPLRKSPSEAEEEVAGGLREHENFLGDIARTVHISVGVSIAHVSRRKHVVALRL